MKPRLCLLAILAISGCANPNGQETVFGEEIKVKSPEDVLRENLRATQAKDIEGVLKTVDDNAPGRENLRSMMTNLFALYDLAYELEKMELLEMKDHSARFKIVLVTRKRTGPAFRDNRVTYIQLLVKNNNEWRLSDTIQEKVEFI